MGKKLKALSKKGDVETVNEVVIEVRTPRTGDDVNKTTPQEVINKIAAVDAHIDLLRDQKVVLEEQLAEYKEIAEAVLA